MKEGWSCIQGEPGWKFQQKVLVLFKQDEVSHPSGGFTALIANLQFMWMFPLFPSFCLFLSVYLHNHTHKMRVKAKILVRGVRQMNCKEIPDIWQMAVRRFSRVQSMLSCLYKLYWAHWTKEVNVTHMMNWGCIQLLSWKILSFQINKWPD